MVHSACNIITTTNTLFNIQKSNLTNLFLFRVDGTLSRGEGSSSKGRKTLIPNLRCLAAIADHRKGFRSKPRGQIQSGVPKAVGRCLAFRSGNSCSETGRKLYWFIRSFGFSQRHLEGDSDVWAARHLHIIAPRP